MRWATVAKCAVAVHAVSSQYDVVAEDRRSLDAKGGFKNLRFESGGTEMSVGIPTQGLEKRFPVQG
ncbi:hypothetical protein G3M74_13105 [Paenibacillus polymyxa]|nr:hypothetical protein [Paenibacillus polymyxa]